MRKSLLFFREVLSAPASIGAIAPSSRYLARRMVESVDWKATRSMVEIGPGTGALTEQIVAALPASCRFFAIEANPVCAQIFRDRYPSVKLYRDSVENVRLYCEIERIPAVDCLICSLPWSNFTRETQGRYLDALLQVLRPGGQFLTFAYLHGRILPNGERFRRMLRERFGTIAVSPLVWPNIPPAYVYSCRR